MLGAPDFVATGIELVDEALDAIDAVVDVPVPLEKEIADFKQFIEDNCSTPSATSSAYPVELYAEILQEPGRLARRARHPGAAPTTARHLQ